MRQGVLSLLVVVLALVTPMQGADLPPELPLWEKPPQKATAEEQVRSLKARADSPSGSNRAFSFVSAPTYSVHRPNKPNGVGLVICPGGGFVDVWIDREGHDLAIWLKKHNVTSLVLKYRTRPVKLNGRNAWLNYQRTVQADAGQAIRILRKKAKALGLRPDKIGICGFSAGGHLAINCAVRLGPKKPEGEVNGMPDFAALFYPGIPDDVDKILADRTASSKGTPDICPMFIVNARVDRLTPADRCVDFYAKLLKVGVNAELHVFSKGGHGFDLGVGRGKSTALWPNSFVAWLRDVNMVHGVARDQRPSSSPPVGGAGGR